MLFSEKEINLVSAYMPLFYLTRLPIRTYTLFEMQQLLYPT